MVEVDFDEIVVDVDDVHVEVDDVVDVDNFDDVDVVVQLLTIGSNAERFSESDVETTEWLAVLLGNVMHHNEQLYVKQDQLALVLRIASHAVTLFQQGCVVGAAEGIPASVTSLAVQVEDPRFWMSAFDAQIAQAHGASCSPSP